MDDPGVVGLVGRRVLPAAQRRGRKMLGAHLDDRRVRQRATADDLDPQHVLGNLLLDTGHGIRERGRTEALEHVRDRSLDRPALTGEPAQVGEHRSAGAVRPDDLLGLRQVETAVARTIGQEQQRPGEAVAAEVGALPDLLGPHAGEGRRDGPPAQGTAGVAVGVGADEDEVARVLAVLDEGLAEGLGRGDEVCVGPPRPAQPGPGRDVDGEPLLKHLRHKTTITTNKKKPNMVLLADRLDLLAGRAREHGTVHRVRRPGALVLDEQPATGLRSGTDQGFVAGARGGGAPLGHGMVHTSDATADGQPCSRRGPAAQASGVAQTTQLPS